MLISVYLCYCGGIQLIDPFGNEQTVYPRLYAYVCDHEESCKVINSKLS
jgi:hypothetical protein